MNGLDIPNIRLFVYGTLRQGQQFHFYIKGAEFRGYYYTEGQLMKSEQGSVYIDKAYKGVATIGEVYIVSFYALERINFLEALSGQFPKGYDLDITPIWRLREKGNYSFDSQEVEYAFYYRRKNGPAKILDGDYTSNFEPIEALQHLLKKQKGLSIEETIERMRQKLKIFEYINDSK